MERARPPCSSRLFTTMTMSQPASVHSVQCRPGFRHCRGGLLKTTSLSRLSQMPRLPRPTSKFPSLACWSCLTLALQASDLRGAGRFADPEDRTCDGRTRTGRLSPLDSALNLHPRNVLNLHRRPGLPQIDRRGDCILGPSAVSVKRRQPAFARYSAASRRGSFQSGRI